MSSFRLDKIVCDSGLATRSEARGLIATGRVRVNGRVETHADLKIELDSAEVSVDGKTINGNKFRYFMLNKPEGVLTATEDREQKTVLDILPEELRRLKLFPVGRLDKDTTGLLILTNDGEFCHAVTSPKKHIKKLYEFTAAGELSSEDAEAFKEGITLRDGTKCLPAGLEIDKNDLCHGFASIYEGKYHQVKRMLASRGKPVVKLKRLTIGELRLDEALKPGDFREIFENERRLILNKVISK
jgi:16S rRNA pseudouridine516 synthase